MGWTNEQLKAINTFGQNIIVSAGAGSGKTAVLTQRVLAHLKRGIHIHELLILTFTKAAAGEMKDRIRQAIKKNEDLILELKTLDDAYITTFDAFSLAIVKKYHYLLNLPSNPKITDATMIEILQKKCMREVLDNFYEKDDKDFEKFIKTFCIKDDENIEEELLKVTKKLEVLSDFNEYLDNYVKNYYKEEFIEECFKNYEALVMQKRDELKELLEELEQMAPSDYNEKLNDNFKNVFQAVTYNDLNNVLSTRFPVLPRNIDDEVKIKKEEASKVWNDLKDYFRYGMEEDLKRKYKDSKETVQVLINIFKEYFKIYQNLKKELGYYDFATISYYALKLLKNFPEVLEELKSSFKEIMVDEYQDTNELQEEFLRYLGQDNVYMVGDIKQSIYRFRNANPYLFKAKYDLYSLNKEGIKIDLLKNFRSRKEVLQDINLLFNPLMDDFLGGADYINAHQMVFGNMMYEEAKNNNQDYRMEIYSYPIVKDKQFTKDEIEAFIIAKDIKERILKKELIVDKETKKLREINYSDFCILMDRTSDFDLYRNIFSYFKIPLTVYKDEILSGNIHFLTIKNCFILLNKLVNKEYDYEFKMALVSLERGFLFRESDEVIYKIIKGHNYFDSEAVKVLYPILKGINGKDLEQILEEIIEKSNYYEKLITLGNITDGIIVINKMKDFARDCGSHGYTYEDFVNYLKTVVKDELQVKYANEIENVLSVKIMTIHKSKGLEFPICYFSGLFKKFNLAELKEQFLFNNHYGLVVPIKQEGLEDLFIKDLVKKETLEQEISEKIRLFYVALTRAKEKMIFVLPELQNDNLIKDEVTIKNRIRLKYRSFADFLNSLKPSLNQFIKIVDISSLQLTKDYLVKQKRESLGKTEDMEVFELKLSKEEAKKESFSKKINKYISKEEKRKLLLGNKWHEILHYMDFHNPRFDLITDEFMQKKIMKLYNQSIIKDNLDGEFWQEYEFISKDNTQKGVIDLFILKKDKIILIDYKLQKVEDEAYKKQLRGYKNYLKDKFNLPVEVYLYSILGETFTFLDI